MTETKEPPKPADVAGRLDGLVGRDECRCGQATPHHELMARLLDSRIAKSELEWAAAREIEKLREAAENARRFLKRHHYHHNAPGGWIWDLDAAKEAYEALTPNAPLSRERSWRTNEKEKA